MLVLLALSGCAGSPRSRASLPEPPPPKVAPPAPEPERSAGPASPDRTARTGDQLARVATELAELQNAMAKLMAAARQHDDQLLYLTRRINELDARNRGRGGSAFAPPPASPSSPSLPPVGTAPVAPPPRGPAAGPAPPTSPAADLFQTATAKYQAGDLDAAVIMLYDLVATYPTHPLRERAQYLVADIFYTQKDLRGALAEFEALLAAVPAGSRVPDALLKVGLCQRGLGDEARARRAWERVIREYPSTAAARQARVLLRTPKG